jgi:hypothetical protein
MPRLKSQDKEPNPKDPRIKFLGHKERGPEKFTYTFQKVADAIGVKLSTMRSNYASEVRKMAEEQDLLKLAAFVTGKAPHIAVTPGEIEERYGPGAAERWSKRYPRFGLYLCPIPGCETWVLTKTCCAAHGGLPAVFMYPTDGYFIFRLEGVDTAYHRVVMGATKGQTVRHLDGNQWNNRVTNLELVNGPGIDAGGQPEGTPDVGGELG